MLSLIINNALLVLFACCVIMSACSSYVKFYISRRVLNAIAVAEALLATVVIVIKFCSLEYDLGYFSEYGFKGDMLAIFGWFIVYATIFFKRIVYTDNAIERGREYICQVRNFDNVTTIGKEKYLGKIKIGMFYVDVEIVLPEGYCLLKSGGYVLVRYLRKEHGFGDATVKVEPANLRDLIPAPVFGKVYDFTVKDKRNDGRVYGVRDYVIYGVIKEKNYPWSTILYGKDAYEELSVGDTIKVKLSCYCWDNTRQIFCTRVPS